MPLKLKRTGQTHPTDFTTFEGAFGHFLATWYEKPQDPIDTLEIRHAFFAGATYLKAMVSRAQKKTPAEAQKTVSQLFQELVDEAARNAASPWPEKFLNRGGEQPSAGMDLPGAAPGPKPDFNIASANSPAPTPGPDKVGEGQDPATPQPMMWTIGMVQEFDAGFRGAMAAGAPTFPFKGRTFRTSDAPAILTHLREVFARDQPQTNNPPQQ